ncbi:MAG: hypothetical protein M3317_15780 [Actinomycetota bacterium]|nr:hypothetical protein [Actinomycetota bacterium]
MTTIDLRARLANVWTMNPTLTVVAARPALPTPAPWRGPRTATTRAEATNLTDAP